ncbi:MAG TPA: glycosyltransferase [Caulobacteraceae bacterium]|nr:glycosyltransferase [Caulobacteraceae bacterium]
MTATSLDAAYGGPAFSVSQLASALGGVGVDVGVWSADGSVVDTDLLEPGARVKRLGGELRGAAAAFAPEVVHDNGLWLPHNHQVAGLAQAAGWPRVVSTRGMLEPWAVRHKRWKKAAAWRFYQHRDVERADALHATAEAEAANLAAMRLRAPVHTIPNGVDLPELSADRRAGDAGPMTAVFLGRIYPVKGLPVLVEAWARVRPAGWRLVIAGPDEAGHRREVEAAIAAAGLGEVVSFPGPVAGEAKAALLQGADLFVLPSHSESFGMALAEALAHGAPVLTTTAVPWPALEARQCGWRAPPTVEGLAEGLRVATARDRQTLRAMGRAGRELIAAEYGWPRIASAFVALYEGLARNRRAGSPRGRLEAASPRNAAGVTPAGPRQRSRS